MSVFSQRTSVLKISLFAIFSVFVVEVSVGIFTNSLGLITDGIHALLDCFITFILLLAVRMAIKPPDAEHTYGHGKIESLGGLIGGIAIILIAIFFIYESINRIQNPFANVLPGLFAITGGFYAIGIDVFRIILLKRTIKKIGGVSLKADYYHAFMDVGSTIIAIAGIALVTYGLYYGDFIAALILGIVLAVLSLKLIYNSAMDLTDIISPNMVSKVKDIVANTQGVVNISSILMRKSGDMIFADITISLRGDTSFDKAHEISNNVENNIKNKIENSSVTIHFEPTWKKVPRESKINEITNRVIGVKDVHNISTYLFGNKLYVSLHVMVDRHINLEKAHKISEIIEDKIKSDFRNTEHVTIHLEPYVTVRGNLNLVEKKIEYKIRNIIKKYTEIKQIGRITTFNFQNTVKIDIDCSFDKELPIEKVHDLTSEIEHKIHNSFANSLITIHPEPA